MSGETNTVLVGRKPVLNYVLACLALLRVGVDEVCIKARGRAISRAVDVAEVLRSRFVPELKVKEISIGTEQVQTEEAGTANVSTIEIILSR